MGPGPAAPGPVLPRFFRRNVLLAFLVLALAYVVVTFLVPSYWLETPLGLFTLFLAPGYALAAILLGPKPRWVFSLTFALVVGLSVALNVGVGLILLVLGKGLPNQVFALFSLVLLFLAAFLWPANTGPTPPARFRPWVKEEFLFPGHSPEQRALAYGLLVAIVFILVVIIYFASVAPSQTSDITFGITGPGGTNLNLPMNGSTGENLSVWVTVGNNGTTQTLSLVLESALQNTTPSYTNTTWTSPGAPISLGPGVRSTDALSMTPGESLTVRVHFQFTTFGNYALTFLLESQGGQVLRQAAWDLSIK